jgi:hypothetical protein
MISLEFTGMRLDPTGSVREDELIAGVFADFRISNGPDVYLVEPSVPVLELARALLRWGNQVARGLVQDFEFDSIFDEDIGLVWIRRMNESWSVGSSLKSAPAMTGLTLPEVNTCVGRFVDEVIETGSKDLEVDLKRALTWNGKGQARETYRALDA